MSPSSLASRSDARLTAGIEDLSHLHPEDQTRILLQREEQLRAERRVDDRVYLLRGRIEEVMARIGKLEEAAFDIDGTLTGIGDRELFAENIAELQRLRSGGLDTTGLTGRHYHQVADLWKKHGDTGLDRWYVEQGFYRAGPDGRTELFAGTPELEASVGTVRDTISAHLPGLAEEFGVDFEVTSSRGFPAAHQSMVSYDALLRGTLDKITDRRQHERLLERFRLLWSEHDPENRIAKTGTSSIGTYEWTTDGLSKQTTLSKHQMETGRESARIAFFGDSSNDQAIFESDEPYLKGVIVNPHTKQALIQRADIAAVGIGNASPILRLMNDVRGRL